ncbi:MAG TPA: toll/interleukin-1 receptor domain-containing protein [Allosphingosinicella sp.]
MAKADSGEAGGYVAFISYSHKDAAIGRWLHRRLEAYRLPRRLAGSEGEDGRVPDRLTPIFRDREELPAAGDLSEKVRAALAASRNLIVVCSPHSAASPWVAKEIATFRELHPDRPILAAIVAGDPQQCFPPPLREGGAEPLAADLRPEGDGRRLGLLKLVAGLAGIGLDALVQRDAQRRVRRVTYVTAAAVAAMLVMALLTAIALNARADAQRQRAEAEGLVEFMLTDLRTRLKGVTNLGVLTAVNRRALDYYRNQDLSGLPAASLERRSRLLHAMGEDDMNRGNLDSALRQFREAARTTGALLAESPQDPDRIFAHAQSEFWIGSVDYKRRNYDKAKLAFDQYKALADRLVRIDPSSSKWRTELAWAEGNLCTLAVASRGDLDYALRACTASVVEMQRAAQGSREPEMINAIANRYAWLADVHRDRREPAQAWQARRNEERLLSTLLAGDPENLSFKVSWVTNQFSMAELELARGKRMEARKRLLQVLPIADALTCADPANREWAAWRARVRRDLALTGAQTGGRNGHCS